MAGIEWKTPVSVRPQEYALRFQSDAVTTDAVLAVSMPYMYTDVLAQAEMYASSRDVPERVGPTACGLHCGMASAASA